MKPTMRFVRVGARQEIMRFVENDAKCRDTGISGGGGGRGGTGGVSMVQVEGCTRMQLHCGQEVTPGVHVTFL